MGGTIVPVNYYGRWLVLVLVISLFYRKIKDIDTKIDKSKCPEIVRNIGTHQSMVYYKDGKYYWDYQSVKDAFEV